MRSFRSWLCKVTSVAAVAAGLAACPAVAGPPYVTDDPVPTDPHHWEIYAYTDNSVMHGDRDGEVGLDINFGLVRNVQLTAVVSGGYANGDNHGLRVADTEVGVKYRFVDNETSRLQVAFFPKMVLPTDPGGGRVQYELPVWAQKDFGKWSVFGGGGVTLRSSRGARDSWEEGIALTRQVTDAFSLGIEAAHSGSEHVGEPGATTVQLGLNAHLAGPFSLLAASGPVIEDHTARVGAHAYASILTTF